MDAKKDLDNIPPKTRLTATVTGQVQGVGFRFWVRQQAEALRLTGRVSNKPDGSVEITAEGSPEALEKLLEALNSGRPPGQVENIETSQTDGTGELDGFGNE